MELKTDAIREPHLALLRMENRHGHVLGINQLKSKWIAFLGHAYNGYFANALWVTEAKPTDEAFSSLLFSEIFPELNRTARENIELWKKLKCFFKWLDIIAVLDEEVCDPIMTPVDYSIEPSLSQHLEIRQVHVRLPEPASILPERFHGVINYLMGLTLNGVLFAMPSVGNILVRNFLVTPKNYSLSFQVDLNERDLKGLDGCFHDKNENIDLMPDNPVLEMALLDDLLQLLGGKLEKQLTPCINNPKKEAVTELTLKLTLPIPDR